MRVDNPYGFQYIAGAVPVLDKLSDLGDPVPPLARRNGLESGNEGLPPREGIAPAPTTTPQARTYTSYGRSVMTSTNGTPNPQRLKALVHSIVSTAAPERIILFGSAARGDMHADSDIDLLVIKSNCRTLATAAAIYGNLPVGGVEADITVMRPEQVAANAECPSTFVPTALAEGKTIYERTAIHRPGQSSLLAAARKKQARHREGVQPHQPGLGRTLRIGTYGGGNRAQGTHHRPWRRVCRHP